MKVAVLGATGQLGHDVVDAYRAAGDEVAALRLNSKTEVLADLEAEGLVNRSSDRLALTRKGRAVLDSVVKLLADAKTV